MKKKEEKKQSLETLISQNHLYASGLNSLRALGMATMEIDLHDPNVPEVAIVEPMGADAPWRKRFHPIWTFSAVGAFNRALEFVNMWVDNMYDRSVRGLLGREKGVLYDYLVYVHLVDFFRLRFGDLRCLGSQLEQFEKSDIRGYLNVSRSALWEKDAMKKIDLERERAGRTLDARKALLNLKETGELTPEKVLAIWDMSIIR